MQLHFWGFFVLGLLALVLWMLGMLALWRRGPNAQDRLALAGAAPLASALR